mgnify:CR=1 FL=1
MNKKCAEVREMLPMLINGNLGPEEKKVVLECLAGCTECRRELAFIIGMKKAFESSLSCEPDENMKVSMLNRIMDQIAAEKTQQQAGSSIYGRMLGNIAANPSPFGIIVSVFNGVKEFIDEKTYNARQELKPAIESMRIFNMFCRQVFSQI